MDHSFDQYNLHNKQLINHALTLNTYSLPVEKSNRFYLFWLRIKIFWNKQDTIKFIMFVNQSNLGKSHQVS